MGTKAYIVRACIRYRDLQPYENTRQPAATGGAPAAPPRGCAPPTPPWPPGEARPHPRPCHCPHPRGKHPAPTPAPAPAAPPLPVRGAMVTRPFLSGMPMPQSGRSGIPTMRSESLSELAALRKGNVDGRLGPRQVLLQRAPLTRPRGRCRRRRSPTGAPNQIRILRESRIR